MKKVQRMNIISPTMLGASHHAVICPPSGEVVVALPSVRIKSVGLQYLSTKKNIQKVKYTQLDSTHTPPRALEVFRPQHTSVPALNREKAMKWA